MRYASTRHGAALATKSRAVPPRSMLVAEAYPRTLSRAPAGSPSTDHPLLPGLEFSRPIQPACRYGSGPRAGPDGTDPVVGT